MVFRPTAGAGDLRRGRLVRLQHLRQKEIEVKKEQRGEVTPPPAVDVSLPDFEAAVKLREDGKLTEARDALVAFIQKYPNGKHLDEARDVLGDVNTAILLLASSISGKDRIHCETRRRAGEDCAQAEDDSGDDHAHEQYERHHAADWRPAAHLASRFLHGDPAQGEPDCGVEPRRVFQAISRARGKAAAETTG